MSDVKIKVIDSDKLIKAINEGSYDVNLSAVMALGAVMLDTKKQEEIIRCKDCMHNGSFDTDCPINWSGKEYCSFAERKTDK